MQALIPVLGLIILAFLISIPCGYLRENFARYSFLWFLLIHIPIPFIVLLRLKAGFGWHVVPFTLGGAVAGQIVGSIINRKRKKRVT